MLRLQSPRESFRKMFFLRDRKMVFVVEGSFEKKNAMST